MKKFLSLCLTLCILFSAMVSTAFAVGENEITEKENREYWNDQNNLYTEVADFTEEYTADDSSDAENVSAMEELEEQPIENQFESIYGEDILAAYESFCEYVSQNNLPVSVSVEVFSEGYQEDKYSLDEYLQICINEASQFAGYGTANVSPSSAATSNDETWFYNTSTGLQQKPNYSKYNLLNIVQAGDIIHESEGGGGITGHCVMVEGIYYSTDYAQYYIRVVEAIGYVSGSVGEGEGVCRGILDDDRIDSRGGTVLRVRNASSSQKTSAASFCVSQIGKEYDVVTGGHSTSSSSTNWYCSELVWAAYYNQGIDLESDRGIWVTPQEIYDSSETTTISKVSIGTPTISSITTPSTTSVKITWGSVSGVSSYYIYRATSINGTYSLVTTTTATSYTNSGLTAGSTYYYRVAAYKSSGLGNKSPAKGVRLSFSAPIITTAYTPTSTSSYLEWTAVYNSTGYYVYRSTSASGTYSKIATTSSRSYTDTGLTSGTTYYYKIVAYNSSSTSAYSSYKATKPVIVDTPMFYYSIANSKTSVTIRWTNVPNATKYYVYRSTTASGTYSLIGNTSQTTYTDSGLSSGTTYYYKVRAFYNNSYSSYSSYRAVTTSS